MDEGIVKSRLVRMWESVRQSFWFVPALMVLAAALLAVAAIWADGAWPHRWRFGFWSFRGGAETARVILTTIAGSIITVAGVVFSITIVALVMASTQFGPRLLRNFMRNAGNQISLGAFVAVFAYCLLVLASIREPEEGGLPFFSVNLGILLALADVGVLVFFIHHVSALIRADRIVADVGRELHREVERLLDRQEARAARDHVRDAAEGAELDRSAVPIPSRVTGYLQYVDVDALRRKASERDVRIRIEHRVGTFIMAGEALFHIAGEAAMAEDLRHEIAGALSIGPDKIPRQDPEFHIEQLVEIAVRSLSPGINDPFTAVACVNWLGASLLRLLDKEPAVGICRDPDGRPRVFLKTTTYAGFLDAAFHQIRQNGRGHPAVVIRLAEILYVLAGRVEDAERSRVILHHAALVNEDGVGSAVNESDRKDIESRYRATVETIRRRFPDPAG